MLACIGKLYVPAGLPDCLRTVLAITVTLGLPFHDGVDFLFDVGTDINHAVERLPWLGAEVIAGLSRCTRRSAASRKRARASVIVSSAALKLASERVAQAPLVV